MKQLNNNTQKQTRALFRADSAKCALCQVQYLLGKVWRLQIKEVGPYGSHATSDPAGWHLKQASGEQGSTHGSISNQCLKAVKKQ